MRNFGTNCQYLAVEESSKHTDSRPLLPLLKLLFDVSLSLVIKVDVKRGSIYEYNPATFAVVGGHAYDTSNIHSARLQLMSNG